MKRKYRVVVIGMGIVGSAALWRLSRIEPNVLGIEAGAIINLSASSHGASRIFRRAYWEGESYLPLLSLSDRLWSQLDDTTTSHLLVRSGGLFIGAADSPLVSGSIATAKRGKIKHQCLSAASIAERFPAFCISDDMVGVFEEGAYTIAADKSKLQMLNLALRNGAEIKFGTVVSRIFRTGNGLNIQIESGGIVYADQVILAAGAKMDAELITDLVGLLKPKSVPVYWFSPKVGMDLNFKRAFPAFLQHLPNGWLLYGTPEIDSDEPGIKIGFHNQQQADFDIETHRQPVSQSNIDQISVLIETFFPDLNPIPYASKKCIYTMSPDDSFMLGESRDVPGVFYASACSGHGFKFATGIGDVLARAALGSSVSDEFSMFNKDRFIIKG